MASFFVSTLGLSPAQARVIMLPSHLQSQAVFPNDEGRRCHRGEGGDIVRQDDEGHGRVSVHPCHVRFTPTNPGPVTVTVKVPNVPGTLIEFDNCAVRGIATISPQGSNQYSVTAGPNMGNCVAIFQYYNTNGRKIGQARLFIKNRV